MKEKKSHTKSSFCKIGRRYGSNQIQLEFQDTSVQWREFLTVLAEYGYGEEQHQAFLTLGEKHKALVTSRPDTIAAKTITIGERNTTIHEAWVWLEKVAGTLGSLARTDPDTATKLNAARPKDDDDLWWSTGALLNLLIAKRAMLPTSTPIDRRIEEASNLRERLAIIFGETNDAKQKPVIDTAEIDELDGELYVIMRDFNEVGRAAVRAGLIDRPVSTFRFNHIGPAANRRKATQEPVPQG